MSEHYLPRQRSNAAARAVRLDTTDVDEPHAESPAMAAMLQRVESSQAAMEALLERLALILDRLEACAPGVLLDGAESALSRPETSDGAPRVRVSRPETSDGAPRVRDAEPAEASDALRRTYSVRDAELA
jgi:hypothetical protein